jgi:hypothetical protein
MKISHFHSQPVVGMSIKLCEGRGLKNRSINRCLAWVLAATVLLSGCSGVLFESKGDVGTSECLKLDSGEGWGSYDTNPRYRYDKKNSNDELSIMLKSVTTF